MLEFQCPHCNEVLSIPEQFIGTTGTCRKCRNPITIDVQEAVDPSSGVPAISARPPELVAFHCEVTGTSSRRHAIVEIAGIKIGLNGEQIDTFWSYAKSEQSIPEKITEKTGITDDMVNEAPPPSEVIKRWFEWIGPNAILFCQHAHFNGKFICAALYQQDLKPPDYQIIDVVHWARELALPVQQYRFRTLLEHLGYPVPEMHRALDTAKAINALVKFLTRKQAGVHLEADQSGVLSRFKGKKTEVVNEERAYEVFDQISKSLDETCGSDFFVRDSFIARINRSAETPEPVPRVPQNGKGATHDSRWFKDMGRQLKAFMVDNAGNGDGDSDSWGKGEAWMDAIVNAAESEDQEKQRTYCKEAISLGALDPWPYEQLVDFYVVLKDYSSAHQVCEKYFETEGWKASRWADSSMKLLRRLVRLERRLADVN